MQLAVNEDPADGAEQLCEREYWAQQDANYNVLGVADSTGVLVERYEYTPYGQRRVYASSGANDPTCLAPVTLSQRVVWAASSTLQPYGLLDHGHQGLHHDEETGLVYNRARHLHTTLERFVQRDPLGYVDGMNGYLYLRGRSNMLLDPTGRVTIATVQELLDAVESGELSACEGFTKYVENRAMRSIQSIGSDLGEFVPPAFHTGLRGIAVEVKMGGSSVVFNKWEKNLDLGFSDELAPNGVWNMVHFIGLGYAWPRWNDDFIPFADETGRTRYVERFEEDLSELAEARKSGKNMGEKCAEVTVDLIAVRFMQHVQKIANQANAIVKANPPLAIEGSGKWRAHVQAQFQALAAQRIPSFKLADQLCGTQCPDCPTAEKDLSSILASIRSTGNRP